MRIRATLSLVIAAAVGILFLGVRPLAAQTSMEGGPRVAAMGGAGTGLPGDVWGVSNPASWSTVDGAELGLFATQAYNIPEMRLMAARYVQPTPLGTLGLGAQTFGYEAFRKSRFSVGASRAITLSDDRHLHAALTTTYTHLGVEGFGNAGAIGLSAGILANIVPTLYAGAHATNFNSPKLGDHEELPRQLAFGLGYVPHPSLRVAADLVKDVRFPLSVRAGLEGRPVDELTLRAGIATEPVRFAAGLSLHLAAFSASFAAEQHEVLGWSPAVAMGLSW